MIIVHPANLRKENLSFSHAFDVLKIDCEFEYILHKETKLVD